MVEKAEDNLRALQQQLQQHSEALENAVEVMRSNRFEGLKDSQVNRNNNVKALRDEYEMALMGLENQLEAKKEKQLAFLKGRLEMRRIAREKELQGMTNLFIYLPCLLCLCLLFSIFQLLVK